MKKNLSYSDQLFIARKQNAIARNREIQRQLYEELNQLLENIQYYDDEIKLDRDSIRLILGRSVK